MSDEEDPKLIRCIQEALRKFLQPIKNDDPQLDFYAIYKRETQEYDTEYMQKYNEDLNTTLIFAGLFSAVSSAFVIDVQSKLEPDSGERSEAYLRAILLTLDRSLVPGEGPATPPAWDGPPAEVIMTSNLLYASLLMSLLAAFVAMLGKQWLNRYLRHTGGSMIERCGDRQRKFDGLERWPFHFFIESLPIILQIALLLLACGLSRYTWSINASVAGVVISFTILGMLFYVGIVIAGTSSYEYPFQTPASISLRHLRDSGTSRKLLASLTLPKIILFVYIAWRNIRKLLVNLSPPNATSLIYAAWMDAHQGLVFASHQVHDATRNLLSWGISLSRVMSGIRSMAKEVGRRTIVLLLWVNRASFRNTKQRLVKRIRRFRCSGLLPTTTEDADRQPLLLRNDPGLRVRVWNLENIQRQNTNDARCICWVLRNVTDPEAIDSVVRLAGIVRWFDGNHDLDPPFDFIVSIFEACFDSTKQPYPGMRDRAYFSARAILQINMGARTWFRERASKYPIPVIHSSSFRHTDPDLHHIICMLECNVGAGRPTFHFPRRDTHTHTHSLWVSSLLVDVTRAGPNPVLKSYESYLGAAIADHQPMIANTLLVWYMFLGGRVGEETFWAVDKSDLLETILSHLSTRVMDIILNGNQLRHLYYLLEFLAAWEKRPVCLTPMVYLWCSAISEVAGRPRQREMPITQSCSPRPKFHPTLRFRFGHQQVGDGSKLVSKLISPVIEDEFSEVGPGCDPARLDDTAHCTHSGPLEDLTAITYVHLLSIALEIGFRLVVPGPDQPALRLDHTSNHNRVFETAFSSRDDEVIADAVCAWIADGDRTPPGSCVRYLAQRVERNTPFSPRLRRVSIRAIERIWPSELEASVLETVRLLDRLNVGVDDLMKNHKWGSLLVGVINSLVKPRNLSSHYWCLLDKLPLAMLGMDLGPNSMEVTRALEESEDWEKLETWMVIAWRSVRTWPMKDARQVTLKLLLRRPLALPRFEDLCRRGMLWRDKKDKLQRICDQARTEQSPSKSSLPQIHTQPLVPFSFAGDDTF